MAPNAEPHVYGDSFSLSDEIPNALQRVTSAAISATARRLFDEKRYVRVVLRPEDGASREYPR